MKNDESILILLVITIVVMAVSLFALHDALVDSDKTIQQLIEQQDKRIADYEREFTYRIDELRESDSIFEERIDEAEIRLDDHMGKIALFQIQLNEMKATPTPTAKPETSNSKKVSVKLSNKDIRNIAALVYLEAGSQSYRCQKAVASVVINRMIRYNKTATQVIYEPNVFSVSGRVANTTPSSVSIKAVKDVINNGTILPKSVVAFRNGHYHNFGKHYCVIDGVYFTSL